MGYGDRTFCRGEGCAMFETCPRALTERVKAQAEIWWGGPDAPIVTFTAPRTLHCYVEPKGGTS